MTLHAIEGRDLMDAPAKLRRLADDIEAGEYGQVHGVAVVVRAVFALPVVLGFGPHSDATATFETLHVGANRLREMTPY